MAKKNKKQLFASWVSGQYHSQSAPNVKLETKVNYVYGLHLKDIDISRYKTKNKKVILWEHFIKLIKDGVVKHEKSNPVPVSYAKARRKIIKRLKGKVDPESFYLTDAWFSVRNKVKRLYGARCMKCRSENTEMHVDHIMPRSKYPMLELDIHNLQILCKKCNLDKSNLESIDYRTDEQRKLCSDKYS